MTFNNTAWRLAQFWSALERAADVADYLIESASPLPTKGLDEPETTPAADCLTADQDCGDRRKMR
jgi:hypothetical protein